MEQERNTENRTKCRTRIASHRWNRRQEILRIKEARSKRKRMKKRSCNHVKTERKQMLRSVFILFLVPKFREKVVAQNNNSKKRFDSHLKVKIS